MVTTSYISDSKVDRNQHNETSLDSNSNLSADYPIEKCSLNPRRSKNADTPKRQLLTGYIIYASEVRKQVVDRNPNQNFGDISRLVGTDWKALPRDIKSKYELRASMHNRRVKERGLNNPDRLNTSNGTRTMKLTRRKMAKLAKEQMRQHHLNSRDQDRSPSIQTSSSSQERPPSMVSQTPSSTGKHQVQQHSQPTSNPQTTCINKTTTAESSTQTTPVRFVEPPVKKRLVFSESFKNYMKSLREPNKDLISGNAIPERPPDLLSHWLDTETG